MQLVICKTPLRISYLGGGTDYPQWFREHGGMVIGTTIKKYCYISCRKLPKFFNYNTKLVYSKIEEVNSVDEIEHDAVKSVIKYLGMQDERLEIHYHGDLPARTGTGTSSAFLVCLLNSLQALQGIQSTQRDLANAAIYIEQSEKYLGENVGCQDQIWAAHGGLKQINFEKDGNYSIRPIILPYALFKELEASTMLFYSGIRRTASKIAGSYVNKLTTDKQSVQKAIAQYAEEGYHQLTQGHLEEFGRLIHSSWMEKKQLSNSVTCPTIDTMYEDALSAGAWGGKIIGAGGGGFLLLLANPNKQEKIREALHGMTEVDIKFDLYGSQVVFNAE